MHLFAIFVHKLCACGSMWCECVCFYVSVIVQFFCFFVEHWWQWHRSPPSLLPKSKCADIAGLPIPTYVCYALIWPPFCCFKTWSGWLRLESWSCGNGAHGGDKKASETFVFMVTGEYSVFIRVWTPHRSMLYMIISILLSSMWTY